MIEIETMLHQDLGRRMTWREQEAVDTVTKLMREMVQNLKGRRFELEQERQELDREMESLSMRVFVIDWEAAGS